uniref:Complex I-B14.7 n=1 Tax=Ascaris lumbricoides TaxID=6252 RepID=A0A0M3HLP7_ASCLU
FNTGTGPGSVSRGSQFKTALAAGALGAVGGIVTYELGKVDADNYLAKLFLFFFKAEFS